MSLRVVSFGGGVQSTALLVLAANGELAYDHFLFSNVGDDSENPATIAYIEDFAVPYARHHGISLIELRRVRRPGSPETLLQHLYMSERSIGIPVRVGEDVGAPGRRQCTTDWKIKVVYRWLTHNGATEANPAAVALGISMDESHRMNSAFDPRFPAQLKEYPLLERRLYRDNCEQIIVRAGLPIPPKSSCWFCPLHTLGAWREQARNEPDLFEKSVRLEALLNTRREELGKDRVFFTSRLKPLPMVIQDDGQQDLFDGCESGYCMT